MNEVKKKPLLFRIVRRLIENFYRKYTVEFRCDTPKPGNIYISNHAQIHGPIGLYLYFFQKRYIWVIGQMCKRKEVTPYAMEDFWREKSKISRWFYKLFSVLIVAPLGSFLLSSADTIAVYKDVRLRKTISQTISSLDNGYDVIIFPEHREKYNKYINDFQKNFVDVARPYCKKTNKPLLFYPVYICPDLKKILIGEPVRYDITKPISEERQRIIDYLQQEITKLADSLPNHKIIPYDNVKKKAYKQSQN